MNMANKLFVLGASILLSIGLISCGEKPAENAGKAIDQTMEKTGDKMNSAAKKMGEQGDEMEEALDDTAITTQIKTAVLAEAGLKVLKIHVDTVNGVTTLTGTVDSQQNRGKAERIALAVTGVKRVDNQLEIVPAK